MTSHENYENVRFKTVDGITLCGNLYLTGQKAAAIIVHPPVSKHEPSLPQRETMQTKLMTSNGR